MCPGEGTQEEMGFEGLASSLAFPLNILGRLGDF